MLPPRRAAVPSRGRAVLPDLLAPGLAVVFCGTAASTASARRGAYYAGPGNAFWPTLHRVGLTPRALAPEDFRDALGFGIGLTDLCKHAAGADHALPGTAFDRARLQRVIAAHRPAILAFTGKRAAREFLGHPVRTGLQAERLGDTAVFVLPSPSGAARGHWRLEPWQALAALCTANRHANCEPAGSARCDLR